MKSTARLLALLLPLLAACSKSGEESKAPAPVATPAAAEQAAESHLPPGIDWFPGDVDAAFAAAKAANKPVFLYWGAIWCPPCAQIKSTIFNRREFQERAKLFVPVYLDGDLPSAQRHGEHFGVVGYPTMILFRPDGTEITRLPGGVDVARYATILDVALGDARPVKEILATALQGGELSEGDWKLLTNYAWSADNGRLVAKDQKAATFRQLFAQCPPEQHADCARLFFEYVNAAAAGKDSGAKFTGLDRAEARARVLELLGSPAVCRANVSNVLYGAEDAMKLLSDKGSAERRGLVAAWNGALDRIAAEQGLLSAPEQLLLLRERAIVFKLGSPEAALPPELLARIRESIATVDASTTDPYARQAAINAAAALLLDAGLEEDANRLLVAELGKSQSPYYFMLDIADLAKKAGHEDEAVKWLARAYAEAEGPATRFQWGANYLLGLIEMKPEDAKGIETVGLEVLGELERAPDALYQRTRLGLERLDGKLLEWGQGDERAKVLESLRARVASICPGLPEDDPGRTSCERFLRPAKPATQGA
jgi:thioredoxin-related protein